MAIMLVQFAAHFNTPIEQPHMFMTAFPGLNIIMYKFTILKFIKFEILAVPVNFAVYIT